SRRQRLRNRTHSPHHVPVKALQLVISTTQQMKQKSERCSWLIGSAVFAIDVIRQKQRLHLVRFIAAIEKVAQASRQEGNKLRNLRSGNGSKSPCNPEQI